MPSLSELMFELDLGDNLVGRTAFCVEPADRVGAVPSVGGTKKIKWQRLEHLAPSHVLVNIDAALIQEYGTAFRDGGTAVSRKRDLDAQ